MEFTSQGKDILPKLRHLAKQGLAKRVIIRDANDRILVDLPLALLGAGALLAPLVSGLACLLSVYKQCKVELL